MSGINNQIFVGIIARSLILLLGIVCFFPACTSHVNTETNNTEEAVNMKDLEQANRMLLDVEKQEIIDFMNRYKWEMKETGSGLYYHIYSSGEGLRAEFGKTAVIDYNIYLLNGDLVYSSDHEGSKRFKIGRGGVVSGLEEAILLLRVGDKARFIMPAHMAHGIPGDGDKIPGQATIVYEVTLTKLHA